MTEPLADAQISAEPPTPEHTDKPRSLGSDAWATLRKRPTFWVSAALIFIMIVMAAFPSLFTFFSPHPELSYSELAKARQPPSSEAWFGYDNQGRDVYTRTIHGARSSILVGLLTTLAVLLFGSLIGIISGFYGKWVDAVLSRVGEIFFAIPLLLGGILVLYTFPSDYRTPYLLVVGKVVLAIGILGWPRIARIMRSTVLQVKPNDYVQAARALGASPGRIVRSHILPNAFAPVVVVATIDLGAYIATEATLSFLGIGLQPPTVSWGIAISEASGIGFLRAAPHMLLFPSVFLSLTVLAFIMLGDAIQDAFDPKSR
ncbi:MAG: ABC transporter permease [Propionibacterium sp.]|nr:ABC transporter permease [Propionibacterium sp.]